jgi:hypothetical protein
VTKALRAGVPDPPLCATVWLMGSAARAAPNQGFCAGLSRLGEQSAERGCGRLSLNQRRGRRENA